MFSINVFCWQSQKNLQNINPPVKIRVQMLAFLDMISPRVDNAAPFYAPVAQLDRVPGYEPGGRRFESFRARHFLLNHSPV